MFRTHLKDLYFFLTSMEYRCKMQRSSAVKNILRLYKNYAKIIVQI